MFFTSKWSIIRIVIKNGNILHRLILYSTILVALFIMQTPSLKTSKLSGHIPTVPQFTISKPVLVSAEAPPVSIQTPQASPEGVLDSSPKLYIYNKESGNKPTARNAGGCLGLGQACPGSKLLAVCPDLNNYACQDAFFTRYMQNRYGTWENAKAFWLKNHWW